jgi:hypothetical protein
MTKVWTVVVAMCIMAAAAHAAGIRNGLMWVGCYDKKTGVDRVCTPDTRVEVFVSVLPEFDTVAGQLENMAEVRMRVVADNEDVLYTGVPRTVHLRGYQEIEAALQIPAWVVQKIDPDRKEEIHVSVNVIDLGVGGETKPLDPQVQLWKTTRTSVIFNQDKPASLPPPSFPPPPVCTISINPNPAHASEKVTLTWAVLPENALVSISGLGRVENTGSVTVSSTATMPYVLSATNTGGTTFCGVLLKIGP